MFTFLLQISRCIIKHMLKYLSMFNLYCVFAARDTKQYVCVKTTLFASKSEALA